MSEANVNKKRKNRWAFPLGLVITVFAVIGLVCVILAGVNATKCSFWLALEVSDAVPFAGRVSAVLVLVLVGRYFAAIS